MSKNETLNLFVSVLGDNASVATTQMKTQEEIQNDIRDAGSDEEIWGFMAFDPDRSDGLEILQALAVTANVQNTLEELATDIFKWGQKFERERMRKALGLNEK